jgi:branched-chain amino acid transport system substrate-binding protein
VLGRVRDSGARFLVVVMSQAASDALISQWHDGRYPFAIGGVDVNSSDPDFFRRVHGKALSQISGALAVRAPVTAKTLGYWEAFSKKTGRAAPVYTGPGAYDAVHVYAEAVRRAQTIEAQAVIRELEMSDSLGVLGRIQFDDAHDVRSGPGLVNLAFVQWQGQGEQAVVWPPEMRTAPAILPPWLMPQTAAGAGPKPPSPAVQQ